jgi:adenylate kinase family enzyme
VGCNHLKKVLIIGIVASGKTTLAKRLSRTIKIPWYEFDDIVHHQTKTGRYKRTVDEQIEVIKDIDNNGVWIFEGTDRPSYHCLFEMADTIIFLDTPLWKRKVRILTRFLKQNLGIEKCSYKPNMDMLKMMFRWTREFERNRDNLESRLWLYKEKVIRLHDNNDLNECFK